MNEREMKELIKWLDIESEPLLVQGTEDIITSLLKEVQ
jgi:hypothetical protein